jgi:hypothetical protein
VRAPWRARLEPGAAAVLAHGGVVARAARLVDERERAALELGERDRVAPGERVVVANGEDGALLAQELFHDAVARLRAEAERDLQLAVGDQRRQHAGVVLAGDDADVRPRLGLGGEQPLGEVVGARREPEAQLAPPAAGVRARDRVDVVGRRDRGPRVLQDRTPCLGERHRARRAVEEPDAQLVLEAADLLAERRLGYVQLGRGATEVQRVGHGHERTQQPRVQTHACSLLMRANFDHRPPTGPVP